MWTPTRDAQHEHSQRLPLQLHPSHQSPSPLLMHGAPSPFYGGGGLPLSSGTFFSPPPPLPSPSAAAATTTQIGFPSPPIGLPVMAHAMQPAMQPAMMPFAPPHSFGGMQTHHFFDLAEQMQNSPLMAPQLCCHQCKTSKSESLFHLCTAPPSHNRKQCKKKYCDPCFFESDARVLTDGGFMFLADIELRLSRGDPPLYACFDRSTQSIAYRAGALVLSAPPEAIVEFTDPTTRRRWDDDSDEYGGTTAAASTATDDDTPPANHLSMRVTSNHEMFVHFSSSDEDADDSVRRTSPMKLPASALTPAGMCACETRPDCRHARATISMTASALRGVVVDHPDGVLSTKDHSEQSPAVRMQMHSEEQLDSFLELYGYWLGAGAMSSEGADGTSALLFRVAPDVTRDYLSPLLSRACLMRNVDWTTAGSPHDEHVALTHRAWASYFDEEYRCRNPTGGISPSSDDPGCADGRRRAPIEPHFLQWVLRRLDRRQLRLVIAGLQHSEATLIHSQSQCADEWQIRVDTVCFRDQLVHACLHAGYSAYFTCEVQQLADQTTDTSPVRRWMVHYSDVSTRPAIKVADVASDLPSAVPASSRSIASYDARRDGRVWCVTVDHPDSLILVQRAFANSVGVVTKASRPIVVGNCLKRLYGMNTAAINNVNWRCPACEGRCTCAACLRTRRDANHTVHHAAADDKLNAAMSHTAAAAPSPRSSSVNAGGATPATTPATVDGVTGATATPATGSTIASSSSLILTPLIGPAAAPAVGGSGLSIGTSGTSVVGHSEASNSSAENSPHVGRRMLHERQSHLPHLRTSSALGGPGGGGGGSAVTSAGAGPMSRVQSFPTMSSSGVGGGEDTPTSPRFSSEMLAAAAAAANAAGHHAPAASPPRLGLLMQPPQRARAGSSAGIMSATAVAAGGAAFNFSADSAHDHRPRSRSDRDPDRVSSSGANSPKYHPYAGGSSASVAAASAAARRHKRLSVSSGGSDTTVSSSPIAMRALAGLTLSAEQVPPLLAHASTMSPPFRPSRRRPTVNVAVGAGGDVETPNSGGLPAFTYPTYQDHSTAAAAAAASQAADVHFQLSHHAPQLAFLDRSQSEQYRRAPAGLFVQPNLLSSAPMPPRQFGSASVAMRAMHALHEPMQQAWNTNNNTHVTSANTFTAHPHQQPMSVADQMQLVSTRSSDTSHYSSPHRLHAAYPPLVRSSSLDGPPDLTSKRAEVDLLHLQLHQVNAERAAMDRQMQQQEKQMQQFIATHEQRQHQRVMELQLLYNQQQFIQDAQQKLQQDHMRDSLLMQQHQFHHQQQTPQQTPPYLPSAVHTPSFSPPAAAAVLPSSSPSSARLPMQSSPPPSSLVPSASPENDDAALAKLRSLEQSIAALRDRHAKLLEEQRARQTFAADVMMAATKASAATSAAMTNTAATSTSSPSNLHPVRMASDSSQLPQLPLPADAHAHMQTMPNGVDVLSLHHHPSPHLMDESGDSSSRDRPRLPSVHTRGVGSAPLTLGVVGALQPTMVSAALGVGLSEDIGNFFVPSPPVSPLANTFQEAQLATDANNTYGQTSHHHAHQQQMAAMQLQMQLRTSRHDLNDVFLHSATEGMACADVSPSTTGPTGVARDFPGAASTPT